MALAPPPHKTRSKLVGNLTQAEYVACKRLTNHSKGAMSDSLTLSRSFWPRQSRVVLIEDPRTGQLLGWALAFPAEDDEELNDAHFYVRARYRRRGLGTKLVEKLGEYVEKPLVFPWDKTSKSFFKQLGDRVEIC